MMQFDYDPSEMNVIDTREPQNYLCYSTPDELGRYEVVLYNNATRQTNFQFTDFSMREVVARLNYMGRKIIPYGDGTELSDFKIFGSFIIAKLKPSERLLESAVNKGEANVKFTLNTIKRPQTDPMIKGRYELLDISSVSYEIV